jgi:hypothetical protein
VKLTDCKIADSEPSLYLPHYLVALLLDCVGQGRLRCIVTGPPNYCARQLPARARAWNVSKGVSRRVASNSGGRWVAFGNVAATNDLFLWRVPSRVRRSLRNSSALGLARTRGTCRKPSPGAFSVNTLRLPTNADRAV